MQIGRTTIVTDVSSFLPGPADARQQLLIEQLRNGISTRLVIVALRIPEGAAGAPARAALENASRQLRDRLARHESILWVNNGDPATLVNERQRLFDARYLLSPASNAEAMTSASLALSFAELERQLNSSFGTLIRQIAPADPTLESLRLLRASGLSPDAALSQGVWIDARGTQALLLLESRAPGSEIGLLRSLLAQIRDDADQVLRSWPIAQVRPTLDFAGPAYFGLVAHDALGVDAERLSFIAIVLVALLLWWTLRSPRLVGIAALPVLSGALVGFAVVGGLKGSIHGITLAFGVTLIGEAVDYAIYTYVQRREDGSHPAYFWRQIALATATSLIGFAAMFFSGFQGLQQLGLFSIFGLLAAAACTRWLLPDLLVGATVVNPSRVARMPVWVKRGIRLRWPLLVAAGLMLSMLVSRSESIWLDSLDSLSAGSADEVARDARYREQLQLPDLRTMIAVNGRDIETALQTSERVVELLDQLVRDKLLIAYDSPTRVLPSQDQQARRQAGLPDADTLRSRIREAVAGGNLRAEVFEPFVEDVQRSRVRPPIGRDEYNGSLIGHWLSAQILERPEGTTVLMNVRSSRAPQALNAELERAGLGKVLVLDLKHDVEQLVAGYRQQAMRAALIGSAGILLVLALRVRRRAAVISMTLTLVVTVAITAGGVALYQGNLTVFNLVSLLLVVGVASNYTLFFSTLSELEAERNRACLSVLLAAGSTFIAFSMLALSRTPVLANIGATVALGALVGLVASVAFAPAVVSEEG